MKKVGFSSTYLSFNANTYFLEDIYCVKLGSKLPFIFLAHVVVLKLNHVFRSTQGIHLSFLLATMCVQPIEHRSYSFSCLSIWLHTCILFVRSYHLNLLQILPRGVLQPKHLSRSYMCHMPLSSKIYLASQVHEEEEDVWLQKFLQQLNLDQMLQHVKEQENQRSTST